MSIFDIFSFKNDFAEAFSTTNISFVKDLINKEIKKQIKKNIPGQEKMDNVVDAVITYINDKIHSKNKIVQWIIDHILLKNVRLICQSIYEDLKEVVEGL